jgi:hypothetical protein
LAAQNDIIAAIRTNMQRCGYSDKLLRADYSYEDGMGKHTVPLAGFASPVHDSRTSCISVVSCNGLEQVTAQQVNRYRGLGAPVVFVCFEQMVEWWTIEAAGAKPEEKISRNQLEGFFNAHKQEFAPERIWRAKNLGNVVKGQQLHFVDAGLMPVLEYEMGERLGGLMKRVIRLLEEGFTEGQLKEARSQRWVFQAGFWVLCAKILKDKGVRNFTRLRIDDIDTVLEAVQTHYGSQQQVEIETQRQRQALEKGAGEINKFGSLSNLTTEAFGYMYENVLVDKRLRSALGIHATPSYLVDYIVWQLWPWIEQIPEDRRVVLEPACGHAPFLTAAMRLLKFLYTGREQDFHRYAKSRMIAVELDSFAQEIARLSLTMADVPNPNGWNILGGDIYRGDVLSKAGKTATILLCNPPFENFSPDEQNVYEREGQQLRCFNKAAEMLWRTLPYMSHGSVFGVVLPQGFLHKKNLADIRKTIINDFELSQICPLPEGVFTFGRHKSVLLFGRKGRAKRRSNTVLYRYVPKEGLKRFREKYEGRDQYVLQSKFVESRAFDVRVRELDDVWDYCERNLPRLSSISEGGQGLIYRGRDLPKRAKTFEVTRFEGAVRGYALFDRDVQLHQLPKEYWMNLSPEVIRRPMWGLPTGTARMLMNYARVGSGPWRIKALIEHTGRPVTSTFLAFEIQDESWSLFSLWAILNSPYANAYMYCNSMERHNLSGTVRAIPIPFCRKVSLEKLEGLVGEYFRLMEQRESQFGIDVRDKAKHLLLSIDAEVMHLYDLPPKMEKRILDLFQGVQRKGVDFAFTGYYPEGFESAVPLHEYLSEEYQRSTVAFADEWVKKHRSREINAILRGAVEAFEEE